MEFDFSYDNIGGLMALYAIPVESFVRLRRDYVADTYNLELRAKDNIIIIPVLNDSSYSLDTSQEESSHGDATRIIIEAFQHCIVGLVAQQSLHGPIKTNITSHRIMRFLLFFSQRK